MTLFRTSDPAAAPVTLAEVKAYLRLGHSSEDDLLAGLIAAATEDVEKSAGLALIVQSWRLVLDKWPTGDRVALLRHPVIAVQSVTMFGTDGEATLLDPAKYQVDPISRPARLHFEARPTVLRAMNGIEIDFTAGFGEAGTDVPDLLKRAILVLAAHWYEFRAQYGAADQPVSYPDIYQRLIAGYRARRL